MSSEISLKSLTAVGSNEILQSHSNLTFKLLKTVADFSQALATLHDKFGHELQMLVETFRKRNGELRKERLNCPNSLFQVWELFLQQVEVNSQQHGDVSRSLAQTSGSGLIERVFHRKIQSKKTFAHRERIETILLKANELLHKCYKEYCQAYAMALTNPAQYMSEYIASHNVYVHQLQATNGMIHAYQTKTLPKLLEELEECHLETSSSISSSLLESSEVIAEKSNEQASGYSMIASACRQANHRQDLAHFIKVAASSPPPPAAPCQESGGQGEQTNGGQDGTGNESLSQQPADRVANLVRYHQFQAASLAALQQTGDQFDPKNLQLVPKFKNEIAPDLSQPPSQQQPQLEKDRESLEEKIERLEERLESLSKLLFRSSESRLNNKVNELQEEICQKRFDLMVAQIHLTAVRSQLQLFEYNYRPSNLSQSTLSLLGAVPGAANELVGVGGQAGGPAGQLGPDGCTDQAGSGGARKSSANHHHHLAIGYRSKWIKALKSLKETPGQSNQQLQAEQLKFSDNDQLKSQADPLQYSGGDGAQQQMAMGGGQQENQHFFQEYTFKKIASCDVCKDFLRGHMRQGFKCKLCKISCHNDCQSKAHATIKCQQPKIKLLRRQKSAGELEVNYSDAEVGPVESERISSKPDGIYQLIRQVLDAKKRGQQPDKAHQSSQLDEHHLRVSGAYTNQLLAGNGLMNLSTGNLALANKNGKSVSTSALGSSAAASVDRWAVVMDLLAQSRRQTPTGARGTEPTSGEQQQQSEPSVGGPKRHSKQLDKFKLAARSAAAASKSQRTGYGLQQNQQSRPGAQLRSPPPAGPASLQVSSSNPIGANPLQPAYHQLESANFLPGHHQMVDEQQGSPTLSSHLQHTKSLPVGNKQPLPAGAPEKLVMMAAVQQPGQQQVYAHHPAGALHMQPMGLQQQQPLGQHHHHHIQHQHPQLLNISSQQLHSTSAPHSPQRKRFNLRMKSFSLDSPESPSVMGVTSSSQHNSGGSLSEHQQQPQQFYESAGAGYPPVYLPGAYQQQHQAQYVQQHNQQPNPYQQIEQQQQQAQQSYLASAGSDELCGARSHQHQAHANYHHRHSYHNPPYHYQQEQERLGRQLEQQNQQSSSQSALNSLVNQDGLLGSSQLAKGALGAGKRGSNDKDMACARQEYYDLGGQESSVVQQKSQAQQQSSSSTLVGTGTYVVLYDYVAQRADELQLAAGKVVALMDAQERDWWKVRVLDGSQRLGYFPSSYLAKLYQNERPLQVAQTIQVSNGESCDKLLRGQIVVHTGKQVDNFVTVRTVSGGALEASNQTHYIQCPEKYLMEVLDASC